MNITPDEGLCIAVLNTAARHGLPDLASDALRVLKLMGAPWTELHMAPMVEAFCRNDEHTQALMTLNIMRSNGIEPTMETALPLIDIKDEDVGVIDKIMNLLDLMHKDGNPIDITALQVIIRAAVKLGDLQRAMGTYKSYSEYNVQPDRITYNLLLEGCVAAEHRGLGDVLLNDMKAAKVKANQKTYESMIHLCLTQEVYEDAFYYLEEMKAAGFKPPQHVYESLIRKCLTHGDVRWHIAMEEMLEYGYHIFQELRVMIDKERGADLQQHLQDQEPLHSDQKSSDAPVTLDGAAQRFIETGGLVNTKPISTEQP